MKKTTLTILLALILIAVTAVSALSERMYINKDQAKVYSKPSKKSKVISRLPEGGHVEVQEKDDGWAFLYYVNRKGVTKSGWMQLKYLDSTPAHKHSWGDWKVTKKATCDEEGKKERTCKTCGKTQTKEIEKTEHDWGKWQVTVEATCVKEGTRTRTCAICGKEQTKSYIEDHTFGSWIMTVEPTCVKMGERVRTCVICGKQETQALNTLPHMFEWYVTLEPTDHSAGTRSNICATCGLTAGEESFDPEGTLRLEDRGGDVYNLQQLLVEQGYLDAGGADGIFGGSTEKAVMQYQRDRGLTADGVAWPQTLADLQHNFGSRQAIYPRTGSVDVSRIPDGVYPVSFDQGDVASVTSGVYFNAVHIYTPDAYSYEDIAALKEGDSIIVNGLAVPVTRIARVDGKVIVNGGIEAQGFELWDSPNHDGYVIHLEGNNANYTEQGVTTFMLDPSASFTDGWNTGADPVIVDYAGIADAVRNSPNPYFMQYNTTATIVAGRIVALTRAYVS